MWLAASGMPVVELERLLLMREFQELLHQAQPERQWNLKVASSGPLSRPLGHNNL